MQDLRLIGVHADGQHVLLADAEGNGYRLPLDDALRAAARSDRPRLGQLQIEMAGGLRPKDVQAMVRAGVTAEEIAVRAGWSVEKVQRYEGPILAEREHVAGLARQVRLRPRGAGQPSGSPTLEHRVAERMRAREIDPDLAEWDSRRTHQGQWTVVVRFNAGGRHREAAWDFDLLARVVNARDDEARWLSEDEDTASTGPIPAPHLAAPARPARVYDVEADGGVGSSSSRRSADTLELMETMRDRSAQRARRRRSRASDVPGMDQAPEEALPLEEIGRPEPDQPPPPAHAHPRDDPAARPRARQRRASARSRADTEADGGEDRTEETMGPAAAGRRTNGAGPRGGPTNRRGSRRDGSIEEDTTQDGTTQDGTTQDGTTQDGTTQDDTTPGDGSGGSSTAGPAPATPPVHAQGGAARRVGSHPRRPAATYAAPPELDDPDDPPADEVSESRRRPGPRPPVARPSTRKSGRPSVPSWDDIVFGRKSD